MDLTEKNTPYFVVWCGRTRLKITNIKSSQQLVEALLKVILEGQDMERAKWSYSFKTRGPKRWTFLFFKDGENLKFRIQQLLPFSGIGIPQFADVFEWEGTLIEYLKAYVEFRTLCFEPAGANADVTSSRYVNVPEITLEKI